MKEVKRGRHLSIARKRHAKKALKLDAPRSEPNPHGNTYGQWVVESRRMIEEAERRK
jgi:hypothetical protein